MCGLVEARRAAAAECRRAPGRHGAHIILILWYEVRRITVAVITVERWKPRPSSPARPSESRLAFVMPKKVPPAPQ
jgi:hypothetical protein